jgi:TolB-like protein/tetratricopeptide (TPR) repeat protein
MGLLSELRRRNVFRMAALYVVAAWLIMQVAEVVIGLAELPGWIGKAILALLAVGFPIALVLSWFYELTPAGIGREGESEAAELVARASGRRVDFIVIALLAAGLVLLAYDKWWIGPPTAPPEKSIAVLPFVNMSADSEQEYFSDGISEEILNLLAQLPELTVISRSSAFYFKGKDVPIPTIAEQLNVANVLEGSVRKVGNRVRITAQLIDASSDTHLWSETYDRTLDDIFAVQDEIAAAISAALELKLGLAGGRVASPTAIATVNTVAYDAYLRGRELMHHRERESMGAAIEHLSRAVRLDAGFAPALAQLAMATMMHTSLVQTDREAAKRIATRHLDRAEALEPDLAEVHAGRALLAQYADDPDAVITHARKALAVNPNYIDVMAWLRGALDRLGRYEEAHAVLEQMLVTDPLSITSRRHYAYWLAGIGRTAEAHEMADELSAQSPQTSYRLHASISFWAEGKLADSLAWGLRASPDNWFASSAFTLVGEYDEARRINTDYWIDANQRRWDDAIKTSQRNVELYPDQGAIIADAAEILYRAGRLEEALPLYEQALALAPEGLAVRGGFGSWFTIQLAFLQRHAGKEEDAQATAQIARQAEAALRAAGEIGPVRFQTEALIAAFDRQPDRAITALESALKTGFRWLLFLEDPIFDELQQNPRFVALREELLALLAEEHEKILQLVCFNNPVPDEWQPMTETCAGVAEVRAR